MGYHLVAKTAFASYHVGDIITDPDTIASIESNYPYYAIRVADGFEDGSVSTGSGGATTSPGSGSTTGSVSSTGTATKTASSLLFGTLTVASFDPASFAISGTQVSATHVCVASVAALRALPTGLYQTAFIRAHATLGDGGERLCYWHPTSIDADDGILTFLPTGSTSSGRWKAQMPTPRSIPAQWAGCVGDGVTDDSVNFLAAMTLAAARGVPVYASQTYLVSLSITDLDVWIIGEGTLLWQQGKNLLYVRRTPGPAISVAAVSTVQLGTFSGNSFIDQAKTSYTLAVASVAGITQGQVYILASNDHYPWYQGASGGATAYVFQTQLVRVAGIGLAFTGGTPGQWQEEQTVTGATSGATAQLKSVSDGATGYLVFNAISGAFQAGESLKVGTSTFGSAEGVAFIILAELLYDTYTTGITIQFVNESRFILDSISINVPAGGNPEGVVGSAQRLPGCDIRGAFHPVVRNVRVLNGWTRALQFSGCWQGDVDVFIERLPDDANLSEQAYGYGVEFYGCTDGMRVRVQGGNMRHAVTSNVTWSTQRSYLDVWQTGCPKHCLIHDSTVRDTFNAGFDTHWGCYYFKFNSCQVIFSTHLNRNVSASIGFQNRGFGTTYTDCEAIDAVVGFQSIAEAMSAGFVHVVAHIGCRATRYQLAGFQSASAAISGNHRLYYQGCLARGNGAATGMNFIQYAWNFPGSTYVEMETCKAECFNGSAFHHGGGGGRVFVRNFMVDCRENPNFVVSIFRMEGLTSNSPPAGVSTSIPFGPLEFFVSGLSIYYDMIHGSPSAIFRMPTAGGLLTVNLAGSIAQLNSGRAALSLATGGAITVNRSQDWGDRFANPTVLPQAATWFSPLCSAAAAAQAVGVLTALPFVVTSNVVTSALAVVVATAAGTGGLARLGIYADNDGLPGALVIDAGTVATTAAGAASASVANAPLTNGVYWLVCQTAAAGAIAATLQASASAASALTQTILGGSTPQIAMGVAGSLGVVASGYATVGELPALFPNPAISNSAVVPIVTIKLSPSMT